MQQKKHLLMIICKHCKNPIKVGKYLEPFLFHTNSFNCPKCEEVLEVTEELKEYILASSYEEF
ncbi:hypothetical protein GLW04_19455 [Halobacillus litoralis]|uniref:Uncharacterized protein n=1 Tax=Halobacillus litoralis TaxID=45668 RepID=A0A845E069_9BACI|nr:MULTISPECIES: hypothetical protein [Halobacillus]MYL22055.1 hypothetical protein [Halobacillus litoralis]MYL31964.1 hypothetical protein [Halobacillus halophilus]MYL39970.1 hypothetical protein [Halobacillus litoralis]